MLQCPWPKESIPEVVEFPFLVPDEIDETENEDFPRSFDIQSGVVTQMLA